MKKIIAALLALSLVGTCVYFGFFHKSDEEKIVERFEAYESAYAKGDFEGCLECFDAKSRNAIKGMDSIGSAFGLDTNALEGFFSLGVAAQNEQIKFKITKIFFIDDENAQVSAELWMSADAAFSETTTNVTVNMVKEDGDWYIVEDFSL